MINVAQAAIFGRQKKAPNTFIGGISKTGGTGVNAPIDTIPKLATKLGIAENRFSSFKIIGDDVSVYIGGGTYNMPNSAFGSVTSANANKNITYYYDNDNLIVNPSMAPIMGWAFGNCSNITEIRMNGVLYVHEGFAAHCTNLSILQLNSLISVAGQPFWNNPKLVTITLNNLTNATGSNNMFTNNIVMIEAITPLINKLYNLHYEGCVKLEQAIHDNATTVGTSAFSNCSSINLISIKKAKTLSTNVFTNIKTGCLIKVNDFLRTSNGGLADVNLTYAKNIRGATVEFYDDAGNYVSTL